MEKNRGRAGRVGILLLICLVIVNIIIVLVETQKVKQMIAECTKKEEVKKLEQLEKEMKEIRALLKKRQTQQTYKLKETLPKIIQPQEKIELPSIAMIDEFVRAHPPGWSAEEMACRLRRKFYGIETRIITFNCVKYLLVRLPHSRWYWVTFEGLKLPPSFIIF